MKLAELQPIATSLFDQLFSACVRLEPSGSLRRGKPEPNDLELVAIPATGEYTVTNLFEEVVERHMVNLLDDALVTLFQTGLWGLALDPVTRKPLRDGPRWKKLQHAESGLCCDLFITDRRRWGYTFAVRTGPKDFSKALVTCAHRRTMFFKDGLLHRHAPIFDEKGEVKPCPAGDQCLKIIETPEERDIFDALEIPWIEPGKRTANLLYAVRPGSYRPGGR